MSEPHVIRLNRAWELRAIARHPADETELKRTLSETESRVKVDFPWSPEGADSRQIEVDSILLLTRRFNRPSNLSPDQMVFLRIAPEALGQSVWFNGKPMQKAASEELGHVACQVSGFLRSSNRLDIVCEDQSALAELNVRLIIYESPATQPAP